MSSPSSGPIARAERDYTVPETLRVVGWLMAGVAAVTTGVMSLIDLVNASRL